jgi:hypothetical protein
MYMYVLYVDLSNILSLINVIIEFVRGVYNHIILISRIIYTDNQIYEYSQMGHYLVYLFIYKYNIYYLRYLI